jgi:hypothetical protein
VNTMLSSHAQTLIQIYRDQVRAVRKDHGPGVVDPVVDKFAWERVQKISAEKTADPRFKEEGPKYIRYVILDEILLCNEAKKGLKRRRR